MRVPTERHIQDPIVQLRIELDNKATHVSFSETCSMCGGYGSPCRSCMGGSVQKPMGNAHALGCEIGREGLSLLVDLLEKEVTRLRQELHQM